MPKNRSEEIFFEGIFMRKLKKTLLTFLLLAFSLCALHAQSVELQVIQHDENQNNIRKQTEIIESTIMEAFFDSGMIITNAPIFAEYDNESDSKIIKTASKEALEGMCQYLIVVTVDYKKEASLNPSSEILSSIEKVTWSLVNVKSGKNKTSKSYKINKVSKSNNSSDGVKLLAEELFSDMREALEK